MTDDLSTELQALARRKGYRLAGAGQPGRYWLVGDDGLPATNPEDDALFFNRGAALQFLLETSDVASVRADLDPATGKAA